MRLHFQIKLFHKNPTYEKKITIKINSKGLLQENMSLERLFG